MMFYKLCRMIVKIAALLLFQVTWRGAGNLKKVKGAIFAVNHSSLLDPPIASVVSPRPLYYLAQQKVFQFKFTAFVCPRLNVIAINRDDPEISVLKKIIAILKSGQIFLILPEGTRSYDGELQPAKYGIGLLAVKAKVPIIPGYLKGTYQAWPRQRKFIRLRKISVNIGEPIDTERWYSKDTVNKKDYQEIGDLAMSKIKELKEKCPKY